jgi:hypothetical protein
MAPDGHELRASRSAALRVAEGFCALCDAPTEGVRLTSGADAGARCGACRVTWTLGAAGPGSRLRADRALTGLEVWNLHDRHNAVPVDPPTSFAPPVR